MVLFGRRRRSRHTAGVAELDRVMCRAVSRCTSTHEDEVRGFLIVAIKLDGSIEVRHNYCCTPHILQQVCFAAARRKDLMSQVYVPDPVST